MKSMGMFIIREWKKTLLLFTLFFVSFSLITTTFLLEVASERTIEKIKPEASGVITIKTDIIDYPERLFSDEEVNGEYYKEYNILLSKLKELQNDDRINYIDFNIYKYMYAGTLNGNLSPIIVYNKDDDVIYQSDYENGYNKLSFIMNSIESGDFNDIITEHNNEEIAKKWIIENNNRVIVYGDYDPSLLERRNNNIAISKGRTFSDEEMINGDYVCILEKSSFYEYPDKNINTNDVVSIIDYYVKDEKIVYSKVYQFTVVGIYEVKNKNGFSGTRMSVPIKTIEKLQNDQQFYMNKYDCNTFTDEWLKEDVFVPLVDVNDIDDVYANSLAIIMHQSKQSFLSQPRIEVKNIEDVEIVASEIENDCKDCSNLRVITSTVEYDKIVRPITDLKNSSQLMMVIVIIVSVGILSATVFMVMRDRKVEAGIYMSLGERMHTIVFRRILEVFLISSIAIIMSLKCGNVLGKSIIKDYRIDNINYEDDNQLVRQDYNEINREMVIKLDCLSITKIIIICYGITMASTVAEIIMLKKTDLRKVLMRE